MTAISDKILTAVFHAYDVRGLIDTQLDIHFYEELGKATATYLNAKNIAVGYDIRPTSPEFAAAFQKGLHSCGVNTFELGLIPTEMIYFAAGSMSELDGAVTITASHNPAEWNGAKMVAKHGQPLSGESGFPEIQRLMQIGEYKLAAVPGQSQKLDLWNDYRGKVLSYLDNVDVSQLKLIVDAGNGIGAHVFQRIFGDRVNNVKYLFAEMDGNFPHHVPDPIKEENVQEIKAACATGQFDLGIAIDGDADRVFFLDRQGRNPNGAYTGAVLAKYLLNQRQSGGKIIHDTRLYLPLMEVIQQHGGESVKVKAGHALMKEQMRVHQAIFGTEVSCHFYYDDFYFSDSGMITIAIMLKMAAEGKDFAQELDHFYNNFPNSGEVNYKVSNNNEVIAKVKTHFSDGQLDELDGISINYPTWRFSLRAANTQPLLRLNLEGINLAVLQEKFKEIESLIGSPRDNQPALEALR